MSILQKALIQSSGAIIGGAVQAGLGAYQVYQGKKDLASAKAEIADLRANAPSLAVPSAFSDYYNKAMDRSNLEFQNQQIARRQAGNVFHYIKIVQLDGLHLELAVGNIIRNLENMG